jgi:sulfhydrogenase subunit beta (sulfur reductase)
MEAKTLPRNKLLDLVGELIKDYEVIAPKDERSYDHANAASEVYLAKEKPAVSLKEFLFPQREKLLEYQFGVEGVTLTATPAPTNTMTVIFGARPCDAMAMPIIDKVFNWDYIDSSYVRRRQNTVIVTIACEEPCETCFCPSLDGSPAGTEGADLLLTPLGEVYHVQIITDRGKELVEKYARFFQESDQSQNRAKARFEEEAIAKITKGVDLKGLDKALTFENPVWETLTQQCIDCGICTFLCPTCHCFDILDEGNPDQGERVRLWDACAFYSYTKAHAGQPRPTHYRRYRQRIMHKFRYYVENFGRTLCVGCGRCIKHCPVGIDLTQVLEAARE